MKVRHRAVAQVIAFALLAPCWEGAAYSNYGTALAGYIVQRVSGEPFERYIDEHIFQPLDMQHSTFEQPLPERLKGMASQGYLTASTPPQPYELVITQPAGAVAALLGLLWIGYVGGLLSFNLNY